MIAKDDLLELARELNVVVPKSLSKVRIIERISENDNVALDKFFEERIARKLLAKSSESTKQDFTQLQGWKKGVTQLFDFLLYRLSDVEVPG